MITDVRRILSRTPQPIPGKRYINISLRCLHLLGVAGLAGAYLFGLEEARWYPYFLLAVISGGLMALIAVYSEPLWLVQLRGQAIVLKLLMLGGAIYWWQQPQAWVYVLVILLSGFFSHAPGKIRYYSLWHGRVVKQASDVIKDCGDL